jgi:hypothetical protein
MLGHRLDGIVKESSVCSGSDLICRVLKELGEGWSNIGDVLQVRRSSPIFERCPTPSPHWERVVMLASLLEGDGT